MRTLTRKQVELLESIDYLSREEIRDLIRGFTSEDVILDADDLEKFESLKIDHDIIKVIAGLIQKGCLSLDQGSFKYSLSLSEPENLTEDNLKEIARLVIGGFQRGESPNWVITIDVA